MYRMFFLGRSLPHASKRQQPQEITEQGRTESLVTQSQHSEDVLQSVENVLEEIWGQQPEVQYENSVVESMVTEYEMCDGTPQYT